MVLKFIFLLLQVQIMFICRKFQHKIFLSIMYICYYVGTLHCIVSVDLVLIDEVPVLVLFLGITIVVDIDTQICIALFPHLL